MAVLSGQLDHVCDQPIPIGSTLRGLPLDRLKLRAVWPLITATRMWIFAICRSKYLANTDCPKESLRQFILVSTRLRRWYSLHSRQVAQPRNREALAASFRALFGFHRGFILVALRLCCRHTL